ncbi:MAG: hypothetical protein SVX43_23645 [Cyanobacteriota bacterium]|nr:hypothetical protein [Cyanobacteriota bacterium]
MGQAIALFQQWQELPIASVSRTPLFLRLETQRRSLWESLYDPFVRRSRSGSGAIFLSPSPDRVHIGMRIAIARLLI